MMEYAIRPFHASDFPVLYRICVLTADLGADASAGHDDPEVFGHYFAGPYAAFEPDLCFILTRSGIPCGYILGTRDSEEFSRRCEEAWFPVLRERYALPRADDVSPGAGMLRLIHQGIAPHPKAAAYPAHLHIDLLPSAVGQGWGRRLMERFLGRLLELGVGAAHLGVGGKNERAIGFYKRMGFHVLAEEEWGYLMGISLGS
jgi:ribosomal protein S18 acetylase RimI-like enzyme